LRRQERVRETVPSREHHRLAAGDRVPGLARQLVPRLQRVHGVRARGRGVPYEFVTTSIQRWLNAQLNPSVPSTATIRPSSQVPRRSPAATAALAVP